MLPPRTRSPILRFALAAQLAAPALGGAGPPAGGGPRGEDVAAVRAEFEAVCRTFRDGEQPYYGRRPAALLAERLKGPVASPAEAVRLRYLLGKELFEQGRFDESIEVLEEGLSLAAESRLGPRAAATLEFELGLVHFRAAEQTNCVLNHAATSCILPFDASALHRLPHHGREAARHFLSYLARDPRSVTAAWLLNLARMVTGEHPAGVPEGLRLPPGALEPEAPFARWRDRAPELGIAAVDLAGGAVMDDFDGDGLLDLVSSTWDPCGSLKAFRSDGKGGFEEVTGSWGLDGQLGGLNLMHADYDGDGRIDLLVLRGGWMFEAGRVRNSLLRNRLGEAGGRFEDVTRAAGIAEPAYPTQTAGFADYDGDGDLDLYVGNEASEGRPYPSQLFRNAGDGTFADVTAAAGVANLRYAKAVAWGDYDDDGDPDLYVSNLEANRLYRNDGDGTFTDVAPALGATRPETRSFATWFFDYDNDGDLDLFVGAYDAGVAAVVGSYFGGDFDVGKPVLYRNDGGRLTEVGAEAGFRRPQMPMGANYGDLDNDGYPDVYLGTGIPEYEAVVPNVAFHNDGRGRFRDVTFAIGLGHLQKGHGVAFGDVDNDGDQDLFHQLGGFYPGDAYGNALFENPGAAGRSVTLRLVGRQANRFGVGARIEVRVRTGESSRSVHALAGTGGSFGGSSLQQEIGLGEAGSIEWIRIRWPGSGTVQTLTGVEPGGFYRVVEGAEAAEPLDPPRLELRGSPGRPHHVPKPPRR